MPCILTAIFLTSFEYIYEQSTAVLPHDYFHMGAKATLQDGDGDSGLLEQLFSYIVCLLFIFMSMMIFMPMLRSICFTIFMLLAEFFLNAYFLHPLFFPHALPKRLFSPHFRSSLPAISVPMHFPLCFLDGFPPIWTFVFLTPIPPLPLTPTICLMFSPRLPFSSAQHPTLLSPLGGKSFLFFMTFRILCPNSHVLHTLLPTTRGCPPKKYWHSFSTLETRSCQNLQTFL